MVEQQEAMAGQQYQVVKKKKGIKMSPFCKYTLNGNIWTCDNCHNTIPLDTSPTKPITSCRVGYNALGLKDFRYLFFINRDDYDLNKVSVTETPGVGTELKKLLEHFNLLPHLTYEYNQKFMMLNNWKIEICETLKKDLIIQWLIEAATKLEIKYTDKHICTLIRKAISNYKKKC